MTCLKELILLTIFRKIATEYWFNKWPHIFISEALELKLIFIIENLNCDGTSAIIFLCHFCLNCINDPKFGRSGEGLSENAVGEIMQSKSAFQPSNPVPLNFTFADYLHAKKHPHLCFL